MSTPIRQQYLRIKRQYPDVLLFFRLGDFYETFDGDAEITARELDLVLTSREVGKGQRVPMAGLPYHAVEGYLARLVAKGYRVAICEQTGEKAVDGLMPRAVVRVVTPGTVVEPSMLAPERNNYLVSVVAQQGRAGLAYADISTGEFAATELPGPDPLPGLRQELARLRPAECIVPQTTAASGRVPRGDRTTPGDALASELYMARPGDISLTPLDAWRFSADEACRALREHLEVATLEGLGLAGMPLAARASGALLLYLRETQAASLAQLDDLRVYRVESYMVLDPATRRSLELQQNLRTGEAFGSLIWVLDQTCTAMGGRLLRRWVDQPLLDLGELERRQAVVASLVENETARQEMRATLRRIGDLERATARLVQGVISPRETVALRGSLGALPELLRLVQGLAAGEGSEREGAHVAGSSPDAVDGGPSARGRTGERLPLDSLVGRLDPCQDLAAVIEAAVVDEPPATLQDGGVIRAGFSPDLDRLQAEAADARRWIAGLEGRERERTGIKSLKVGYNKVFGYYIEITRANADQAPAEYIRRQTLVNGERYITPDLKEYEALVLSANERQVEMETRLFRELCDYLASAAERLQRTADIVARLDATAALAETAVRHNYVRPALHDGERLEIVGGRHPVVEQTLKDAVFVPNDTTLATDDAQLIVLTGPNMGGKSTYLRQVALIVLLAQIGSFVPAASASIGLVDRIFTRVGAQDDLATGRSTFFVEMAETANLLANATRRSLLILDEIGRGTSTYDGMAIAQAVVEYIHNSPRLGSRTLFATHYHELTELASILPRVRNWHVAVAEEEERVIFLYRILPQGADRSYGIHVARLAGVPRAVTRRAEDLLRRLEMDGSARQRPRGERDGDERTQLSLFAPADGLVRELAEMDVLSLSPLEALTALYSLNKRAKEQRL